MSEPALRSAYAARGPLLKELADRLDDATRAALDGVAHIDRICFRVKEPGSFVKKAKSAKYTSPLAEVEDQVAGRVITFFRDDIPVVRRRLTDWFGDVEHVVKEPAGPTEFGYESDHYVFVITEHLKPEGWQDLSEMPTTFELQVRTLFMHAWAEPQHDLGYKADTSLDRETARELAWVAASAWGADRTLNEIARRGTTTTTGAADNPASSSDI
jgi:putative GTP pyrophosphokinase